MAITLAQAQALTYRDIVHFCPNPDKTRYTHYGLAIGCYSTETGKPHAVKCRVNGALKTWKRNPERFRIPVKYGLYDYGEITNENATDWYLPSECPICNGKEYTITDLLGANPITVRASSVDNALALVAEKQYPGESFTFRNISVDGRTYSTLISTTDSSHTVAYRTN